MPQASEELRAKWGGYDGVGDDKASTYLEQQGWSQIETGLWVRPQNRLLETVTDDEWEALQFLIDEWDHALCADPLVYLKKKVEKFARDARLAHQKEVRSKLIVAWLQLTGSTIVAVACLAATIVCLRYNSIPYGLVAIVFAILLNGYTTGDKK